MKRSPSRDLALIAVFAALIAALGLPGKIAIPWSSVPITAQTLGVMLAGSLLGARRGAAAVATFLLLVAAGLPLLAGGRGGLAVFASPSAGFLIGWVAGAWVTGWLARRPMTQVAQGQSSVTATTSLALAQVAGGILTVYAIGVPVMAALGKLSLTAAMTSTAAFLPGDLIKVALSTVVCAAVARGYPVLLTREA